ncbi:MAG: glucokinase [Halanaerobiales bacterium]|nr:glucokinase [Halanaerobiales bacterium]
MTAKSTTAEEGDKVAREIFNQVDFYLGTGLANLTNLFNPEMLILDGGAMKAGKLIM